jgi:hypothetical protein
VLWFILLPALALIGAAVLYFKGYGAGATGAAFGGVLLGGFIALMINFMCAIGSDNYYVKGYSVPLQSIGSGSSIHGAFFLGIGTVDGTTEYHYYAKQEDGGFYEASVPTDRASVYEIDGEPHVDVMYSKEKNYPWLTVLQPSHEYHDYYNFYVPKGSVVQTYTLKP